MPNPPLSWLGIGSNRKRALDEILLFTLVKGYYLFAFKIIGFRSWTTGSMKMSAPFSYFQVQKKSISLYVKQFPIAALWIFSLYLKSIFVKQSIIISDNLLHIILKIIISDITWVLIMNVLWENTLPEW